MAIYNNGKGNYSIIVKEELLLDQTWNVSVVPIDNLGLNGSELYQILLQSPHHQLSLVLGVMLL